MSPVGVRDPEFRVTVSHLLASIGASISSACNTDDLVQRSGLSISNIILVNNPCNSYPSTDSHCNWNHAPTPGGRNLFLQFPSSCSFYFLERHLPILFVPIHSTLQ
eukprot:GHVT01091664.1.p1 GENE.GHVT01091664.1~~GHVT01091664.1.p1  ORF type:complete len:106 (+),score=3.83 GHVT01091664.1:205-522(+)